MPYARTPMSSESPVLVLYLQRVGAQPLVSLPVTEALNGRGNQCRLSFYCARICPEQSADTSRTSTAAPASKKRIIFSSGGARSSLGPRKPYIFFRGFMPCPIISAAANHWTASCPTGQSLHLNIDERRSAKHKHVGFGSACDRLGGLPV